MQWQRLLPALPLLGGLLAGGARDALAQSYPLVTGAARTARYNLEVAYPSVPGQRVIVNEQTSAQLGDIDPATIAGRTLTVYRDGRVFPGAASVSGSREIPGLGTGDRGGEGSLPDPPNSAEADLVATFVQLFASFPPYSAGTLGAAWGDYDQDGDLDLPLYRNNGDGSFSEIPGFRTLLANGIYHGASWCDFDKDGDLDLVMMGYNPTASTTIHTLLLRNEGDGSFVDVAPAVGMDVIGRGETPVWGDFDGDGWPDLFAPYYAHDTAGLVDRSFYYRNNGNGTFTEMAEAAGVSLLGTPQGIKPEGADAVDIDDDGDLDIYTASHLFINDGTGHFTDRRAEYGLPTGFDEGCSFIDYDNDGDFDLYVRNTDTARLFRNDSGHFVDVTTLAGVGSNTFLWGDSWADVDNDGDLDLLEIEKEPNDGRDSKLLLNHGDGTFTVDPDFTIDVRGPTAWADVDGDGDLDFVDDTPPRRVYANQLNNNPLESETYLDVRVLDAGGHQTQHGATVRLRCSNGPQIVTQARAVCGGAAYLFDNDYMAHFGLPATGTVGRVPDLPGYAPGAVVQLTAVPATGYHFANWTGDASGSANPLAVVMDGAKDVRAVFEANEYTLDAGVNGSGSVTRSPDRLAYYYATPVQLTATPAVGHHFVSWSGDVNSTANPLALVMTANTNVTANFQIDTYTLAITTVGTGAVIRSPDLPAYPYGTAVQLTAVAGAGYHFAGWTGDATGTENPVTLTMDRAKSFTATFPLKPERIWIGAAGGGDGESWSNPNNWAGGFVPGPEDTVLLDNSGVAGDYTVTLPGGAATVTVASLALTPAAGRAITLTLPSSNTENPGLRVGDGVDSTTDILIDAGGTLHNASGASSGNGIETNSLTTGLVRINAGGRYLHATRRDPNGILPRLSTAPDTETGVFEYDVPERATYAIAASGATYGSLVLTRSAGAATYRAAGGDPLTVRGDLTLNHGVTFSSSMTGTLRLAGDLTNGGEALTLRASQEVVFDGDGLQTLSGIASITLAGNATVVPTATLALGAVTFTNNGTITVQGALELDQGASPAGSGSYVYDATRGTLIFNNTSGVRTVGEVAWWPVTNGPVSVNVLGAGGISMNAACSVTGLFQASAMAQNADRLTLSGTLQVNPGGSISGAPIYGGSATLVYATGLAVGNEWSSGASVGSGVPRHVVIQAGSGTVSMPSADRNVPGDLTLTSGTLALNPSAGNLILQGNLTDLGTLTTNGRAVTFTGSATQTLSATGPLGFDYLKLIKTGGAVRLLADVSCAGGATGNALDMSGTQDTLDLNGHALTIGGTVGGSNASGALKGGAASSVVVNGGGDAGTLRFVPGADRLGALTVNRSGAGTVTLGSDLTVYDTLALAQGVLVTGDHVLRLETGGAVSRAGGFVWGNLAKTVPAGAAAPTFEVGTGTTYAPVDLAFGTVISSGTLTVSSTAGDHPNLASSPFNPTLTVNRYWSISNAGLGFDQYDAVFHFAPADLDEGADAGRLVVRRYLAPSWFVHTVGARTATSTQATGLTGFGDFAIGDIPTYTLNVTAIGNGSVVRSPDQPVYDPGTGVTLAATALPDQSFVGWGGDTSGTANPITLTMAADRNITAQFTYSLTTSVAGSGTVSANPDLAAYLPGTAVQLTATAAAGFAFQGWSGDTTGSPDTLTVVMVRNLAVQASFADAQPPTVQVLAPNGGEVLAAGSTDTLRWVAQDNVAVVAVDLYVSRDGSLGPYEPIATGLPNEGSTVWVATGPPTSQALLRVVAHDAAGNQGEDLSDAEFVIWSGALDAEEAPLTEFELLGAWPNPIRSGMRILYSLPCEAEIRLTVMDAQGREVAVLASGKTPPGRHTVSWDARGGPGSVPPGVYFIRLRTPVRSFVRRTVLAR